MACIPFPSNDCKQGFLAIQRLLGVVDNFVMIKKLIKKKGVKADTMIMSAECAICPVYMEKAFNKGRYADVVVARHTIFTDYQLARLRLLGPRIYTLRLQLVQCSPAQRAEAVNWALDLEECCAQRSDIFREALKMPDARINIDPEPDTKAPNW